MKLTKAIPRTPEARLIPHNRGFRNKALVWANWRERSGLTISAVVSLYRPMSLKDQSTTKTRNRGIMA